MYIFSIIILSSCGNVREKEISISDGTAQEIYKEAKQFGLQDYPEGVLLGYMSGDASVDRVNLVPAKKDLSGTMSHWSFIFAKSKDVLNDGEVNDEDVFSVVYKNSKLILTEYAVVRDWSVEDDMVIGDDLFAYDSDYIYAKLLEQVTAEYGEVSTYHTNFMVMMGDNEVSIFKSDSDVFSGTFSFEEGEFTFLESYEITTY